MRYIKTLWLHENNNYSIEIYSELDTDDNEVRKIEIFSDGTTGYAVGNISHGKTMLGDIPIPSLEDINSDPQFRAQEITKDFFLEKWNKFVKF
ncbi:hypothetical protein LU604_19025 [Erwinia tracheiphila]|uniref:DUF6881 domain-containing protein n=1 Tax=Erwinia tracheiphila TaxID=65700 RepID=A0A345CN70_9GAMM|nr:hypothetical protein [Erwinia tracheiphila]AXF74887.1 hypothetical protein AV903_00190 [Erwinia tracheiphila]UIA82577.1 hypothetical protein LU604_19025 [Erwinia tracheiphila]UIA91165.1 hypothetical protein LU632_18560 [Erwinia tracheiphila]